jgi:predicted phosphodiesterase
MARVLVLGDLHAPATHPQYLDWALKIGRDCEQVVLIGDVGDLHCMSRFPREAGAPGVDDEFAAAKAQVQQLAKRLEGRKVRVCVGNHDDRILRRLWDAGLPTALKPSFNKVWGVKWDWRDFHTIDLCYYSHGTNAGGEHHAWNLMRDMGCSVVIGHHHSAAGVKWSQTRLGRRFAMDVGCGVDMTSPLMNYAKSGRKQPVLGCGVVVDGVPAHYAMPETAQMRRAA